ncbi:MAG: PAS domain-containing protein [Chitinophagaceae bacterium]
MPIRTKAPVYSFLAGGGEMGALIQQKNWKETVLGDIGQWTPSLRTTLSIILHSKFPMFLFWGPELICFYNDAYRPSLGKDGKHPGILGATGKEAWPEIWGAIKPLIDQVMTGGEATWHQDQLLPIYRNNQLEDVYWTFSYSPVHDETGTVAGVFVTCTETTAEVIANKKLKASESNFRQLIYNSPITASVFRGQDLVIELANDSSLQLWGKDESVIGKKVVDAFPELAVQQYISILRDVYETGIPYEGKENLVMLQRNGRLEPVFINFVYKPLRNEQGVIDGIVSMGYEVTDQIYARNKLNEMEERNRLAIDANDIGVYDKNLVTNEVVFSQKMHELYGSSVPMPHASYTAMIHPEDRVMLTQAHQKAVEAGRLDYQYRIITNSGEVKWLESHARVYYNSERQPIRRIGTIQDITAQKTARERIQDAERKFRNTVMQAPVGIVLLKGRDFIVEMANENYLQLVDKKEEGFIGRPLFDSLPEVKDIVDPLLAGVLETGVPYYANALEVMLNRFGKKQPAFFNLVYQPIRESDGSISGVMAVAYEVTEQVKANYNLNELKEQFSNIVMQSPIAMTVWRGRDYIIEIANNAMMKNIWRKEPHEVFGKKALEVFPELIQQKFPALLEKVMNEGIIHRETEAEAYVQGNDGMRKFYLDFEYRPLFEKEGSVSGIMITVTDVSTQVEARQQLEDAEERLRLALDGSGLATWDLNLTTRQIIYSPRLASLFGLPEDAIITHPQMRKMIHPDDLHYIIEPAFDKALHTGTYFYEARIVLPDNTIRWARTQGKVFYDESRKPLRMLGTIRDITEHKTNEQNLQRLASIVQSSDDAIISKTIESIITSWNDAAQRMFGYTAEEMIGQSILKLMPPDKVNEEYEIIDRLKKGKRIQHFESIRMTKDKRLIDVSLTISPLKDAEGKVIGASKIVRDITKQKEAERLINESEQKFRLLADSMPQLIWTGNPDGRLNYFSKTVFAYTGLSQEQIEKDGLLQVIHPDEKDENIRQWTYAVQTGTPFLFEHRFRRYDGEYRWQLSRAIPQKDETGKIQMWVGTSTDIDDIKKHDQQKDDFIKMASHELKTPVTTIKGYVQLLLKMNENGNDPFLANSLNTIDKQVFKLTKLITDLLDVTKIETGSLDLEKESFYIAESMKEIASDLQTTTPTHTITIQQNANPLIFADKDRIAQVIINLFTNAIKYSPKANKVIATINADENNVLISVQDFGIGISQEDISRIFERFYRAAGKDEKTFPGFGIGLFIVNEIVNLHKGRIWVESEKEKGSVFYVSLPLKA